MNEMNMNDKKEQKGDGKGRININFGLLAGLIGGAVLGSFIGVLLHDIPFYTGFGMILGMAISFDMITHIKHKKENARKNDEKEV